MLLRFSILRSTLSLHLFFVHHLYPKICTQRRLEICAIVTMSACLLLGLERNLISRQVKDAVNPDVYSTHSWPQFVLSVCV
jgi:hypothetical protein